MTTITPASIDYPTPAASLPPAEFTWLDFTGTGIDLSTGYTFLLTVGQPPTAAVITKSDGLTGAASVLQSNGTYSANLVVEWDVDELSVLTPGNYALNITATDENGRKRILDGLITIDGPVIQ